MSNAVANLDGLFKKVYGENLENLIPENVTLLKRVKFSKRKQIGKTFNQPVILRQESGITYAGPDDVSGAFALSDSINMATANAEINSNQMVIRSQMSYNAAAKAAEGNSKSAFASATKLLIQSMVDSMNRRLELSMLYGNSGLGNLSGTVNTDATHTVVTLTAATWAGGIWAGSEGNILDFEEGASIINAVGPVTIDSVDVDNKALTVSAAAADITAIDIAGAGQELYFTGTYTAGIDMNGIDKIITNTGSLFGIDASAYSLWKGNTYSAASGPLTIAKLLESTTSAVNQGLVEAVEAYVSAETFADLSAEFAAIRRLDDSYNIDKNTVGSKALRVFGQNGEMNIIPHSMVKDGEAFVLPTKYICRLGATDVSFNSFGNNGGKNFFLEMPANAGYEIRAYSNQAIFIEKPAVCTKIVDIVT